MDAYGVLVASGVSPEAFWEMSWGEVRVAADAITRRRNDEARFQAAALYRSAGLIVQGVSNLFAKSPKRLPGLSEAFPALFDGIEPEDNWQQMREKFHEAFPRQKK